MQSFKLKLLNTGHTDISADHGRLIYFFFMKQIYKESKLIFQFHLYILQLLKQLKILTVVLTAEKITKE